MEINRTESAKFAQAADQVAGKLTDGVEKALAENAARGFPAPTGATLEAILMVGQEAKGQLVEANGKIYEERRGVIFQEQEFAMKLLVRIAKLSFEEYREGIFNALALEQAQQAAAAERSGADVNRLNAETEKRQVAIIRAKAEIEQRITVYRAEQVRTETETLTLERVLVQAQLSTAEKKLEIIDSIYQVLAAEELVLAAERRRAASLELVLEAQRILATIKEEMVPYYLDKAKARGELADAVTKDAAVREEIEKLGYDRLELKAAEEAADHDVREATEIYELAQEAQIRASEATKLARTQAGRLLQEYANQVREAIQTKKLSLEKDGVDFKLSTNLYRVNMGVTDDTEVLGHEQISILEELANILENMATRAVDEADRVKAAAHTVTGISQLNASITRRITAG